MTKCKPFSKTLAQLREIGKKIDAIILTEYIDPIAENRRRCKEHIKLLEQEQKEAETCDILV